MAPSPVAGRRGRDPTAAGAAALIVLSLGALTGCGSSGTRSHGSGVLRPAFGNSGLVTNEYAYRHPGDPASTRSPYWIATSGSLFAQGGAGWTGVPDRGTPNPQSSNATDSAVFRVVSRRRDLGNVRVSFELFVQRHAVGPGREPHTYDGVHVWLRYASDTKLYAMSVMRWDGTVVIKRKSPGGPSNGGTYQTLASARSVMPSGRWVQVDVQAINRRQGVELAIAIDGKVVVRCLDASRLSLIHPGAVGIRADNTEFKFRGFAARPLPR
jgi:hypothetical protein